ncbi:polyadenylation and cleavage factor homolog 4-like isoform X1 [Malus sylvestris]|uniref:polyadenylation and cleavage factor homolog 4-like isoform X1 n=1 Tax=Malus sylvestris TaxID=3752 RepID=UPI0021ACA8C3|nr:polyadenylation and cleavage factor homolog 4-like isoform X1 [Malus sylvestris]
MEMESSRRPFSGSNEPGLKKPRLAENPNGRAFGQRPGGGANPVLSRFRVSDRDTGSDDPNRGGGGYVPQPLQHQELVSQYKTALAELTFNSKPIITNLTIIAGENVHAAKAVAATVCSHIIELTLVRLCTCNQYVFLTFPQVPSEQKLPSLYLLDSIVKNIGRDYIKYFAVRLPEVFCKAYRQVEPPIHQSMRHLFGTWKGVFPAQTLQMIEKELGFSSTANGSSSGAATSRPDSQSQRQAHSIHVNPKYLERQRLQQPTRNLQQSNADALSERVHEKNIGAEYGEYEYGSDLPRNSNPGIGRIGGKITETPPTQRNGVNIRHGLANYSAPKSANADPRLKAAPGIATRNGGGLSSSWKNSEEEEFMWDDMNSRLTDHGPSDISSNSRKDHWASDDSERLGFGGHFRKPKSVNDYASTADLDTSADLTEQKDLSALGHLMSSPWTLQDSIGVDRLTPSGIPVISSVHSDRYASSLSGLSTSGDYSVARMGSRAQVASSRIGASSLGFSAASGPTGALGKQQQLQSVRAASPSGQSLMHQYSPSPTSTVQHPRHHLQSLAEQDLTEDPLPIPTPNARLGSKAKSQPQDLSLSIPAIQSRHKYASRQQPYSIESESFGHTKKPPVLPVSTFSTPSTVGDSIPDHSNVIAAETSGQLSTSSLLAAVMKTGILSDKSITGGLPNLNIRDMGHIPSQPGVQSPFPSGPPPTQVALPGSKVASAFTSGHLSGDNSPASSNVSQKKVGHLPLPHSQPPSSLEGSASASSSTVVNNSSDPISSLLSSLVAKGLISASKSESLTPVPSQKPTELQNKSLGGPATSLVSVSPVSVSASLPVSSRTDDASLPEPVAKTSAALPQITKTEIRNLIGVEFKPDKIREFHPAVIEELFNDLPHKCSICGLNLKLRERLERHLEWHASKNPEANGSAMASRKWYPNLTSWVAGKAGPPLVPEANNSIDEPNETIDIDEPMVPADESQCACVRCGDIFEDFYCQERDEWMFKGASYMSIPSGPGEMETTEESVLKGPIVHVNCTVESSLSDLGLPGHVKLEPEI